MSRQDAENLPATTSESLDLRKLAALSLTSAVLLAAAFPPLNFSFLAYLAPVGWLAVASVPKLSKSGYWILYASGFLFWLIVLFGVGNAHWATRCFGWPALSAYLAIYTPLTIAIVRNAKTHLHVPMPIAAPIAWVALEYARSHFATGFAVALIGHTQIEFNPLVQISDLTGAYGVSFVVVAIAAAIAEIVGGILVPTRSTRSIMIRSGWALPAIVVFASAYAYGHLIPNETSPNSEIKPVRIGMVQGTIDTVFGDPTQSARTFEQYFQLSEEISQITPKPDVIVWPETTAGEYMLLEIGDDFSPDPSLGMTEAEFRRGLSEYDAQIVAMLTDLTSNRWQCDWILGIAATRYGNQHDDHYNAAIHVDQSGKIVGRYNKMHPVMFGEYVPFGEWMPLVYQWLPISSGLTPGDAPTAIHAQGITICPSICFENTVPHLVRRQLLQLTEQGQEIDLLLTLTNDGWFWGSSILDLHLTCARFRAIENRRSMLVVANTGITAEIDLHGKIVKQAAKRKVATLVAEVVPAKTGLSWYTTHGDWFALVCFCLSIPPLLVACTRCFLAVRGSSAISDG